MLRRAFALAALSLALPAVASARQYASPHPIVIELFTSQGCSDCPAADRIVLDLAKRKDVIAISLPITYWDMLGWKDTFATDSNTQRQKAYAKTMNRSGVYTPQIIVDGKFDVVGNQRERVDAAISERASEELGERSVPITLDASSGRIEIAIPASRGKLKPSGTVWVMRTLSQASVNVEDGENKNRQLTYANVVRDLQRAGEWNGIAMKIDLPMMRAKVKSDGIVVILQSHDYGPVLGAAAMQMPADTAQR